MVQKLLSKDLGQQHKYLQSLDFADQAFQAEYAGDQEPREKFYAQLTEALDGKQADISKYEADTYFYLLKRSAQNGDAARAITFEINGNNNQIEYLWPQGKELADSYAKNFVPMFIDNPVALNEDGTPQVQNIADTKANIESQRSYYEDNAAIFGPSYLKASIGDAPEIPNVFGDQSQGLVELAVTEQTGEQAAEQAQTQRPTITVAEEARSLSQEEIAAAADAIEQVKEESLNAQLVEGLDTDLQQFIADKNAEDAAKQEAAAEALQKAINDARAKSEADEALIASVADQDDYKVFKDIFQNFYNGQNAFYIANQLENAPDQQPEPVFTEATLAALYKKKQGEKIEEYTIYDTELDQFLGVANHMKENNKKEKQAKSDFVTEWFNKNRFAGIVAENYDGQDAKAADKGAAKLYEDITTQPQDDNGMKSVLGLYNVLRNQKIVNDDDRKARFTQIIDGYVAAKAAEGFAIEPFLEKVEQDNETASFDRFKKAITAAYGEGRYTEALKNDDTVKFLHDQSAGRTTMTGGVIHDEDITSRIETEKKYGSGDMFKQIKIAVNHNLDQQAFGKMLADGYEGANKDKIDPISSSRMFGDMIGDRLKFKKLDQTADNIEQTGAGIIDQLNERKEKKGEASLNGFLSRKFDRLVEKSEAEAAPEPEKGQKFKPLAFIHNKGSAIGNFVKANWIGLGAAAGAGWFARSIIDGYGAQILGEQTMGAITAQAVALAGSYAPLALEMATGGVLGMAAGAAGNIAFQCWKGYTIARDQVEGDNPELKGQFWKQAVTDFSAMRLVGSSIAQNFSFKSLLIGTALGGTVGATFAFLAHYSDAIVDGAKSAWGSIFGGDTITPPVDGPVDGGVTGVPPVDGDPAVVAAPPADDVVAAPACDAAQTTIPTGIDDATRQQIITAMNADGSLNQVERGIKWRLEHGTLAQQIQAAKDFTTIPSGSGLQLEVLNRLDDQYGHLLYNPTAMEDPQLVRALTQVNIDGGYYNLRDVLNSGAVDGDPRIVEALKDIAQAADHGNRYALEQIALAQTRFPEALQQALTQNAADAQAMADCLAGGTVTPPAAVDGAVVLPGDAAAQPVVTGDVQPDLCDEQNPQGAVQPAAQETRVEPAATETVVRPVARPAVQPDLCETPAANDTSCVMPSTVDPRAGFTDAVAGPAALNLDGFTAIGTDHAAYNALVAKAEGFAIGERVTGSTTFSQHGAVVSEGDGLFLVARAAEGQTGFTFTQIGTTTDGIAAAFAAQNPQVTQAVGARDFQIAAAEGTAGRTPRVVRTI